MGDLNDYKDERGRFVVGNPGSGLAGPGRPREDVAERVRAALAAVLDDETLTAWAEAMRRKLKKGNLSASEFVIDRLIGRPAVVVNHQADGALSAFVMAWQRVSGDLPGDELPAGAQPCALAAGDDEQDNAGQTRA